MVPFTQETELFLDCIGIVALVGYREETRKMIYLNQITYWQDHHLAMAFVPYKGEHGRILCHQSAIVHSIERSLLWYAIETGNVRRFRYLLRYVGKGILDKPFYYYNERTIPEYSVPSTSPTRLLRLLLKQYRTAYTHGWPLYMLPHYPPKFPHEFDFYIMGPPASPYAGGVFHFTLWLPPEFPFKIPKIRCHTPYIYHPQITTFVSTCFIYPGVWSPQYTIEMILIEIQSLFDLSTLKLFMHPGLVFENVNPKAAELFLLNREKFCKHAALMTRVYAQPPPALKDQLSSYLFPQGTPFLFAVYKSEYEIVRQLLTLGMIDVDATDYYGNNALVISINNNDIEMVKLLLEYGIKVSNAPVTGRGETLDELLTDVPLFPKDLTYPIDEVRWIRKEIRDLLQKHGLDGPTGNHLSTTEEKSNI